MFNKKKIIDFTNLIYPYLDTVSKENIHLIKTLTESNFILKINKINNIITKSKKIILDFENNFKIFNSNNLQKKSTIDITYKQLRKELYNSPTFNEYIKSDIKNLLLNTKKKHSYQITIDYLVINLHLYANNINNNQLIEISRLLFTFFKTFNTKQDIFKKRYHNLNVRILLIDFPRILDTTKDFNELSEYGIFNNSSGLTILKKKEIIVTRKTGLLGLLIHELIHLLGLDFCYSLNDDNHTNIINWQTKWISSNNIVKKNNNIISFIEGICNTSSSYFLALYSSIVLSSKFNNNKTLTYFKYFFYIEVLHSYIQTCKILHFFGFNTYQDFFNNTSNRIYYQNAYVFEYVFLRIFLIYEYYNLILKKLLKYKFNKETNSKINENIQTKINKQILNFNKKVFLKDNINKIISFINFENNYCEYFAVNML